MSTSKKKATNSNIAKINNFLSLNSDMDEYLQDELNKGMKFALKSGLSLKDSESIAQKLAHIYDTKAHLEFIRFEDRYFDPLFDIQRIKEALFRLSGYKRSILIIDSLKYSCLDGKKRHSSKSKLRHTSCINFIEDYANLYQNQIPNLEILYL
ncbi:MAG: hypothetical protein R3Y46_06560 [Opitutales bacterium]